MTKPKVKTNLTAERLREVLSYDPETGVFHHLREDVIRRFRRLEAGSIDKDGYVIIGVDGAVYRAHRLAWLYVHGQWPAHEIDHINGIPDDNRITNLREADGPRHQQQNQKLRDTNKSGYPGVYWDTTNGRWRAMIRNGGKKLSLGSFTSRHDAGAAYMAAKAKMHDFQPTPRELGPRAICGTGED